MGQNIVSELKKKIHKFIEDDKNGFSLEDQNETLIKEVINLNLPTLKNTKEITNFSDIYSLEKASREIYETISTIKDETEIRHFFGEDKNFNTDKLRKEYFKQGFDKKFPKFDIEKYLFYLNNPIFEFENFRGEIIKYDPFWVKKNYIAINQMIFNEMDLYILNIGKEGSGKSCWSSQQILYFYEFFSLIGLIDYAYDVQKLFFIDILSFLEEHACQKKDDYFRIECLDEGNELNRSSFRDESNQQFKYEMRTERKMLRIILINMQQIGELDTSISLSRVNFIYNCKMRSNKKMGMLNKGYIDMYIIPRGEEIYSEKNRKNLSRQEILNTFAVKLDKKKDYYVSLPTELVVKSFKFENLWGFDKEEYDSHVKERMLSRKFQKNMKLTNEQGYALLKKCSDFVKFGTINHNIPADKKMYDNLTYFFKNVEKFFEANPDKLLATEHKYGVNKPKSI